MICKPFSICIRHIILKSDKIRRPDHLKGNLVADPIKGCVSASITVQMNELAGSKWLATKNR